MRQLSTKLMLAFAVMLSIFYGCKNDDDGPDLIPPTINTPDDASVAVGATTTLSFSVTTGGGYASASVASDPESIATATLTTEPADDSPSGTVVVTVTGVAAGDATVTLTVTDNENQNATRNVGVTVTEVASPPTDAPPTAGDSLSNIEDLSTLAAAIEAVGLSDTLNTLDQVTIFAPNNAAFTNLLTEFSLEDGDLDGLVAALTADSVSSVLQAHIVADSLGAAELTDGLELTTLNNKTITIANDGTNVFANGAQVVDSDIIVGNGVIHVLDSVINLTEDEETGGEIDITTVADTIASLDDLNSLEAALTAAELVDDLQGDGPFTVFAPNNAAFAELLAAEDVADLTALVDKIGLPALTSILQAHVVADSLPADLLEAQAYTTLDQNATLTVTKTDDSVFVNGAGVITANILASNGVVHIIDSVVNLPMAPPPGAAATVVDTIASREELDALEAALTATNLIEPLQGPGEFTVFAPNNGAFETLFRDNGVTSIEGLIAELGESAVTQILQAHVVSRDQAQTSDLLLDQNVYESLDGATLTITKQGEQTFVNGASVLETDLVVGNGVVHIIDEVVNTTAGNTGANGFTVTIENISSSKRYFQNGVFNTPVDATEAGPAGPGEAFTFSFHAGPVITAGQATRLSFVAMLTGSTDHFLAFGQDGILLYDEAGNPITDISTQLKVYDAGTENDAGEDETGINPITEVGDAAGIATASITNDGTLFTVTITNAQTDDGDPATNEGISPGVYGVHTGLTPIFEVGNSASYGGLEALVEDGDPTAVEQTMSLDVGFAVPLSPGVYAIHTGVSPILDPGQPDFGDGLEQLAEEGEPATLATSLEAEESVTSSGTFGTENIGPGESFSFVIENVAAGDILSLATMMVQSNDIVYATSQLGIPLFDANGQPVNGNVTTQVYAYDVGTELNEYPGAGLNQPIRSADGAGDPDTSNLVRRVTANDVNESADGFIYRAINQQIKVTIIPN